MALNIKNPVAERLAREVSELTGENKTQAVLVALEERLARLAAGAPQSSPSERLRIVLEHEIWPQIGAAGTARITKDERERILGYGPGGY
ncbi:MAG: type II toxin-antitoxin system VapB family antitoxin [Acidimicrobiales bacterium]